MITFFYIVLFLILLPLIIQGAILFTMLVGSILMIITGAIILLIETILKWFKK